MLKQEKVTALEIQAPLVTGGKKDSYSQLFT